MRAGPDGGVVAAFTLGYSGQPTTIGWGEPNPPQLTDAWAPVVMWLEDSSGALVRVLKVGTDQGPPPNHSVIEAQGFAVSGTGDAVVWGTFARDARFFPGTTLQTDYSTLRQQNGSLADIAWDPYLARLSATGAPVSIMRGRTPPPLLKTWFNWAGGLAALPNGDVLVSGQYEQSGFIFADGKPGQVTLNGTYPSYAARVDATGNPVWVHRNDNLSPFYLSCATADSVYLVAGTGRLFADTASPVTLEPQRWGADGGVGWTYSIVKLSPAGTFEWVRYGVGAVGFYVTGVQPWGDGIALAGSSSPGGFELRGADAGVLASVPASGNYLPWVARFEADAGLSWLTTLPAGSSFSTMAVRGSEVKVVVEAEQSVSGLNLPPARDGGSNQTGSYTIGQTFSASGQLVRSALLGEMLYLRELTALADGGLVAVGQGHYGNLTPSVGELDGGLRLLPPAQQSWDQQLIFMRLDF